MNFLKNIADYFHALLNYAKQQEENAREIERLRVEVERLSTALQLSMLQNQHNLENERHQREKFMLQVELELAKRLPPKTEI